MLIAGVTGFVGGRLAERLAADGRLNATCLARRCATYGPNIRTLATDFQEPPADLEAALDAVFLCLGSTPSRAGGKAEFRRVEHDLAVRVAGWAVARGARHCAYVSSLGANLKSASFYLRTKAETEQSLAQLGFDALHVFRPSFLMGRPRPRWSERAGALLFQSLCAAGLGPKSGALRPVSGAILAEAMFATLDDGVQGTLTHHHTDILRLAARSANHRTGAAQAPASSDHEGW